MATNPPVVPSADPELHQGIEEYVNHLLGLEAVFNRQAQEIELGVRIDVRSAINAAREGTSLADIASFFDREDDSGVLHPEQLSTALSCVVNMVENPQQN